MIHTCGEVQRQARPMGWAGPGACLLGHGVPLAMWHRCSMGSFFSLCAVQSMARATSSLLRISRVAGV